MTEEKETQLITQALKGILNDTECRSHDAGARMMLKTIDHAAHVAKTLAGPDMVAGMLMGLADHLPSCPHDVEIVTADGVHTIADRDMLDNDEVESMVHQHIQAMIFELHPHGPADVFRMLHKVINMVAHTAGSVMKNRNMAVEALYQVADYLKTSTVEVVVQDISAADLKSSSTATKH